MLIREPALRRRSGAALFEGAVVFSLTFLILIGMIIGGIGIFRYQEVADLAREGARYASVHGGQYSAETGQAAATQTSVANYVKNMSVGLDPSKLNTTVTWNANNMPSTVNTNGTSVGNTVTVTVNYSWTPGSVLSWLGTTPLTSTSTVPMQY